MGLSEDKLDKSVFDKVVVELREETLIIKYATQDNFKQLLATDNYLEKYQPFFIQEMISESLNKVCEKDAMLRLKEYEHNKYREWHKMILNDDGIPSL